MHWVCCTHFCDKAAVVQIAACQQHIEAGEVSMQNVQAVQVSHARGNLSNSGKDADQVRQAIHGRPVGAEPPPVYAVLQSMHKLERTIW